jgi:uncharacterized protein with GYD domain
MATFILMTRVDPQAMSEHSPLDLEKRVKGKVGEACPEVTWKENFVLLGPYDYLDVFEAPDTETAAKVSQIVRREARATTEVWSAVTWDDFKRHLAA